MRKPRVLVFIDWFLPGDKAGGPVRSCVNLIDHLNNEIDFSVVTHDTDYMSDLPYPEINSNAWNILKDGKRVYYISKDQLKKRTIEKILVQEEYDVLYMNGMWSQPFTAWPLTISKKIKPGIRTIIAVRGMLGLSALAIKRWKKKLFLSYAKLLGLYSDVVFHATSETEAKDTWNVLGQEAHVMVAGNLPRKGAGETQAKQKSRGALKIICPARIAPEKNTLFAVEIFEKVNISVEVDFFGAVYDAEYMTQCLEAVKKLSPHIKIKFHQPVDSDKIPALLARYDLLLLPTRGENFGHVILEAMQAGLPVLISDKTPWRNLETNHAGWDLPLEIKDEFGRMIEMVGAMDQVTYAKWSESALRFAAKYAADEKLIAANRLLFLNW
ncbi:MAG TPA: glycosyltransferase family 4 protein [Bacteroidia bacterium]|nr:glycosyltransferase family 4 protein [Bacteroidia bacterium]